MKKTALFLMALAASLTLAFAAEAAKNTYNHHYDFKDFTSLSVSHSFQVDFTFSDDWTVDISVPDFIQPYLKVTCTGSKVRIGLEKLPKDIQRKLNNQSTPLQATVRMPKLISLNMSGATRLTASGSQVLDHENLHIDVSGASKVFDLKSKGNGILNINCSGASNVEIAADGTLANIDASGASHLELAGNFHKVNLDCSGASGCSIEGDVDDANMDVSGSSKVTVNGNTGKLHLDQSGASKFESNGETAVANVELSGAAKCRITVTKKLDYELSGASTLRVKDLGASISGETNRGSKLSFDR